MSAGEAQIDHVIVGLLRKLGPEEWLTAREAASRTMLSLESASRALSRLVERGLAKGSGRRPRGYRLEPFPVEIPAGYAIERPLSDESWLEYVAAPHRYPDGTTVQVWVIEDGAGGFKVSDGGGALLRLEPMNQANHAARRALERFALERDLVFDGRELLEAPASAAAIERVATASAEAVATIRIALPS